MRVTIKDVGRAAGVSAATVSNVLNSPDVVAPDTRERVTAVIAQLGYEPSRAARALQQQRTFSIGYEIPGVTDGFALDVFLHRMVERAGKADLDIVLFAPRPGQTQVDAYREMIRRGAVDGFVISGTGRNDDRITYLLDVTFPFVTFGRTDFPDEHPWVDVDGRAGVRQAVAHLVETGHHDIALIGWPEGSITGDERAAGYHLGLKDAGIAARDELTVRAENGVAPGTEAMEQLLRLDKPPTAVVAVQDALALGAMSAIRDAGLEVGGDVAVVGFDDIPSAAFSAPPLSSIRQPMESVGVLVIEMLVECLDKAADASRRSGTLVPELIVRASTNPAMQSDR
ncbi:catabolite control protein A [bacterium BMS3Abin02]|nr:catabolite control protein A [bacterium BMS3Abin02]GBE22493.1 catabolite control protein A [bacterium BMS3Bbin01]HDH25050.1 LacI family transcriptional regulator [Actinomycetota bacterium]HDL48901.1 LacI family transcriptional regulator [Actinomycetota bacterium]